MNAADLGAIFTGNKLPLDRFRETPRFACPNCREQSAKANIAINLWRCSACGSDGKATELPRLLRLRAPHPEPIGAAAPEPRRAGIPIP